jgi:opacity protein-like surface antigen
MRKLLALTAGLLGLSTGVHAADNGIYLGAGVGQATIEVDDVFDRKFDGDDLGYKLIAGIRPLDWLAFEVNYVNFGEPDDTIQGVKLRTEGSGLSGFALGFLTLGPVDLFAKAGLIAWDAELRHPNLGRLNDDNGTDFAYGAGIQFRLFSISVRAEYEVFDIKDVGDANMFSVGLTYTFF